MWVVNSCPQQAVLRPAPRLGAGHRVQAGRFASALGAALRACWERLPSRSLRRPFSPVV